MPMADLGALARADAVTLLAASSGIGQRPVAFLRAVKQREPAMPWRNARSIGAIRSMAPASQPGSESPAL